MERPRAVIYARYSSDTQSAASIEDQIRLCKERLASEGWTLEQVYRDAAMSGASSLRPGYQAMLEGAREGMFEIVVAEALDRLSRDQEDVAALLKRLRFAGIKLFTLAEGEINELHVGLKGTMNALFLKDLADKTRRGLRGRVEAGKSGGGNSYGYKAVRNISSDGEINRGDRTIDPAQAAVVRRIFQDYADGISPKAIALALNAEATPAPRGGQWGASSINGNRERGTGILNNEMYVGRLVWNRLGYMKDPETGRRRSRGKAENQIINIDKPEWRIVEDDLWQAVKRRQGALDLKLDKTNLAPRPFWSQQRPRYLFSGMMTCGVCGGGFSKANKDSFGCSTARNKGPTACTNKRLIRRELLENTVLDALKARMMDRDLYKVFADAFTAEWNRQQAEEAAASAGREAELTRIDRQLDRLVDAIADGTPASKVKDKMIALEARKTQLEKEIDQAVAPAPRLHPNLSEIYRQKVGALIETLNGSDAEGLREQLRALIDMITLYPEGDGQRIEVRGELATILGLATGGKAGDAALLSEQIKMVAGTRNHRELIPIVVAC